MRIPEPDPQQNPSRAAGLLHGGEHRPTREELQEISRRDQEANPEFTAEWAALCTLLRASGRALKMPSGVTYVPPENKPYGHYSYTSSGAAWELELRRVPWVFDQVTGRGENGSE